MMMQHKFTDLLVKTSMFPGKAPACDRYIVICQKDCIVARR